MSPDQAPADDLPEKKGIIMPRITGGVLGTRSFVQARRWKAQEHTS